MTLARLFDRSAMMSCSAGSMTDVTIAVGTAVFVVTSVPRAFLVMPNVRPVAPSRLVSDRLMPAPWLIRLLSSVRMYQRFRWLAAMIAPTELAMATATIADD